MYESDQKIAMEKVEVEVEFDNGSRLLGYLFIRPMQRVSDLLGDIRTFLPFLTADGIIVHLRKTAVTKVVEIGQVADRESVTDPYDILGVPRDIGENELKMVYHDLCGQNHPDKLLALEIAPEYVELANTRMIRIIHAYRRIVEMRRGEKGNGRAKAADEGQAAAGANGRNDANGDGRSAADGDAQQDTEANGRDDADEKSQDGADSNARSADPESGSYF
jgi:hypothetical protein